MVSQIVPADTPVPGKRLCYNPPMFEKSADIYDAVYSWKDYEAESNGVREAFERHAKRPVRDVLDVGCGTGAHMVYLQRHYNVEGLDLDPGLLQVARAKLPDLTFHQGNMLDFDLGRQFDAAMCMFGAIAYTLTPGALNTAVENIARHVRPGGVVVVEPWLRPDVYKPGTVHAQFVDQPELKIARIVLSRREGDAAVLDMHYLVGTPDEVRHFTESHTVGLFTREQMEAAFGQAGLAVTYEESEPWRRGLYAAVKPGTP
ncbi:MAG TPA: class I SAM-dependent methyltransferase [Chloroflexia bacterium]|nr:class I SAM-dependent methyltransferase [Chloroflexia bacterium]